jgi:glycosyltransferase involved in cell wall biosynthesis
VRIGFDARAAFLDPHRGFGRVAAALADALVRALPGDVVLFVPHDAPVPPPWYSFAAAVVALRRPRRGAFLFDGPAWRFTLRRHHVDVLHLPTWTIPATLPVPVVATGYDATPLRFPSPPGRWRRHRARRAIRSLTRAELVHAISAHTAGELSVFAGVASERIRVVHLGVGEPFTPAARPQEPSHLLFVGGAESHKNVATILDMLALPGSEALPPLLLVGAAAADCDVHALARARGLDERRLRTVVAKADDELATLYRSALATLVPSRNEGFGLPALEAMACGCPVLAARAGALPEVCGEAALLLDADDAGAWLAAVRMLQADPARRSALADAGLAQARSFTWERSARALIGLYREAAAMHPRRRPSGQ